jgi:hypothetical protein
MNTKTTGLITIAGAIVALAVVATIQSVFAQDLFEAKLFAPGQVAINSGGAIAAKSIAPGERAENIHCTSCNGASNFAPGHEAKRG